MISVNSIICNPFQERCYVIWDERKAAAVIDCGCSCTAEQKRLTDIVERNGLTVVAHWATHGHLDHLFGAAWLYRTYGVATTISDADMPLVKNLSKQAEAFGVPWDDFDFPTISADSLGNVSVKARLIQTPGHSPGGVCYYLEEEKILFSGDTLFASGFGRTDLWGGDYGVLMASLQQLGGLDEDTKVYPGHGPSTTIGQELR